MTDQPVIPSLFDRPDPVDPQRSSWCPPITGKTTQARHASYSGARQVVKTWTVRQSELLQVLGNGSPMSRNQLAALMGWPLSSVCSVLDALIKAGHVESAGDFETVTWADGGHTRRERFTVKR